MSKPVKYYVSVNLDDGRGGNSNDIETRDQADEYAEFLMNKHSNIESVTVYRVNEDSSVKKLMTLFR